MKKKQPNHLSKFVDLKPYCTFCGSEVGQISERTNEKSNAIYDCPKCSRYYCDQCSYTKDGLQFCLRCDSIIEKVM